MTAPTRTTHAGWPFRARMGRTAFFMVKAGLAASNGEARRLVVQGGVLVDGEKVAAPTVSFTADQLKNGIVIKKGKKIYHKVIL